MRLDSILPAVALAAVGTLLTIGGVAAQSDKADVAFMLQAGLYQVGCLASEPDGKWGPASRLALSNFAQKTGQKHISLSPSRAALDLVSSYESQVCSSGSPAQDSAAHEGLPAVQDSFPSPESAVALPQQPVCIEATVLVGAKPNWGERWDTFDKAPDIVFNETSSSASAYCGDSTQCRMRITKTDAGPLHFDIEDEDKIGSNDMIGAGQCVISAQCNLPPAATITMKSC